MPTLLPKLLRKSAEENQRKFSGDPEDFRLTLVEHLEELRNRIFRSVVILAVGWLIGWIAFPYMYGYLNHVVELAVRKVLATGIEYKEVFNTITEPFLLKFTLSFWIGVGISFPILFMELWGFIQPALKPQEAKPLRRIAPMSVVLFFMGAGFAWLILPNAIGWLATYIAEFPGTAMYQHAGTMVFFLVKILIAFGFAFQLPLVVYILGELELLSAETLLQYWRQCATAIFVIAMIVTPSQDPVSMLAMAIPLCILFMISVYAVKFSQARKRKARMIPSEPVVDPETTPFE